MTSDRHDKKLLSPINELLLSPSIELHAIVMVLLQLFVNASDFVGELLVESTISSTT